MIRDITQKIFSSTVSKWQVKLFLGILAFGIILALVLYTQDMVNELIKREKESINLYTEIIREYAKTESPYDENFEFYLEQITKTINFPIISTDANDMPYEPFDDFTLNVEIDTSMSYKEQRQYLIDYIQEMKSNYPPIIVELDPEGQFISKFYYTNSSLVRNLQYFPIVAIVIIAAFILIGYIAFSNIRKTEESKVWVGMAREAAHQLGTPLSSLLAWMEILKLNKEQPDSVEETVEEMQNDVERLNKIATRFSKIGSLPEKHDKQISELITKVIAYFERRLPHLGRKVEIIADIKSDGVININEDLIEWVIENLIKNAAEAIEGDKGSVTISLNQKSQKVIITVKDTGKGMTAKQRRQIFYPGFTTKKRGWGLGLSLARRIIEEYHNGKIYVKDTAPGKGTTFVVELPV